LEAINKNLKELDLLSKYEKIILKNNNQNHNHNNNNRFIKF